MMKPYVGLMQKFASQTLARQPEMDVVMYDREQDEQFTRDGQEGSLAVLYQLIVEALLRLAPQGGRALDIGCGSAQLLCRIASEMPDIRFTGLDLSPHMLEFARRSAQQYGLENVDFLTHSWRELGALEKGGYDLVTWHLALHHCDDADEVVRVIDDAAELLREGGTLFLFDIVRPKTGKLAVHLADMYNTRWGSWYYQDALDSYKAAFTFDEFGEILRRSKLAGFVHVQPMVFNFWQAAYLSSQSNPTPKASSRLASFWQRRDHFMLKLAFGGRL